MKNILLDTNAYSNYLRGDTRVIDALSEADNVYLSIFVLGELYGGFKEGSRQKQNLSILKGFIRVPWVIIVNGTNESAEIYASIRTGLKKKGKPIPTNDIWIAAQAIETGSALITYDKHFKWIDGLRIWDF